MTDAQRVHLMAALWPRACQCQGWRAGDRALRLRVFSQAVGRELDSASELNSTDDFDRVKAHLGMLADNIAATVETDHPEISRARRIRFLIRRQLASLREFHDNPEALMAGLIRDKFGSDLALDDLSPEPGIVRDGRAGQLRETASQLDQVMFTMARILSTKRKAARAGQGVAA